MKRIRKIPPDTIYFFRRCSSRGPLPYSDYLRASQAQSQKVGDKQMISLRRFEVLPGALQPHEGVVMNRHTFCFRFRTADVTIKAYKRLLRSDKLHAARGLFPRPQCGGIHDRATAHAPSLGRRGYQLFCNCYQGVGVLLPGQGKCKRRF